MNTFFVLFILSVSALTECLAANYGNLHVVTSMDVTYPDKKNPKRVEFASVFSKKELEKYASDKHVARLITNVEFIKDKKKFQADEVDISKAEGLRKKKLLFCVHGIDCSAEKHLNYCTKHKDEFKKLEVVPVIWPIFKQPLWKKIYNLGLTVEYQLDKTTAKAAALAFNKYMDNHTGQLPSKSVMAHSMGNRVLRYACKGNNGNNSRFDNIFMCAAAVSSTMFNTDRAEKKDGLAVGKALKDSPHSKIYVLYNPRDMALLGSEFHKILKEPIKAISGCRRKRKLGAFKIDREKLHPTLKGKIENINCRERWMKWSKFRSRTAAGMLGHGYHWDLDAIKFYESKC